MGTPAPKFHFLAQVSLETITENVIQAYSEDTFAFDLPQIVDHGGEKYVAHFSLSGGGVGQANISGPLMTGNPNLPWMEVQCSDVRVMDQLGASEYGLMKLELRKPGHLQGAYRSSIANPGNSRKLIRDSQGRVKGCTPNFMICGTTPEASFLAGEDVGEAEEITGLED